MKIVPCKNASSRQHLKREEVWDLHIWKMYISVSTILMFCLAQPASFWIPGPCCESKRRSQQSSITLRYALQQRIMPQVQFLVPCCLSSKDLVGRRLKNSLSPECSKPHCRKSGYFTSWYGDWISISLYTQQAGRGSCEKDKIPYCYVFFPFK